MLRVAVYSSLLCLIILTVYVRYYQKPSRIPEKVVVASQTSDSAPSPQPPPLSSDTQNTSDGPSPIRGAEGQGDLLKKVLFHEYTHAAVHSITQICPRWIDEGLAEYFSAGNQQKIGQLIPLRNLENSFLGLRGRNIRIAYQESYSAVSYLIEKYGMHRMKEMLVSFSKGSDPDQAFSNAFSKTYADFIREWGKT